MHNIDDCLPGHEPPTPKIPVDVLTRLAPPITFKFEQTVLTDEQIKVMAAQLETDIQQALLKLIEDNGGRIPYNDQTSEAAQKIIADAYNRICEQYGLVTISINVEL